MRVVCSLTTRDGLALVGGDLLQLIFAAVYFNASVVVIRSRRRLAPPGGACGADIAASSRLFAVSPDAKLLFFGGNWDNSLRVYSISRSKQIASVIRHQGLNAFCSLTTSLISWTSVFFQIVLLSTRFTIRILCDSLTVLVI